MKYNPPLNNAGDANAGYVTGDVPSGVMGSLPPAESIEYPQREIVNLITDAGLTPDNADLHQIGRAVQSGALIFGYDSGTVNNYVVNLVPPALQLWDGLAIWVVPTNSNGGPATINVNGLGVKNIVRRGGAVLQAGDMPANYKSLLTYSKRHDNFELYSVGFTTGGFLPILIANTDLYVDAAIGSDTAYDGTTSTINPPHGPFKTIMRAVNETFKYGPSVYTMTIHIAAGTYNESVNTLPVTGPRVVFQGAGRTLTRVVSPGNSHCFNIIGANNVVINDLHVTTGTGWLPPCCFVAQAGSTVVTNNCQSLFSDFAVWDAYGPGTISPGNHYFEAGGSSSTFVMVALFGGMVAFAQYAVFTFLGGFSCQYFAGSAQGSITIPVPGPAKFINAGYVSGSKYLCSVNGIVDTQGQGVSYFPGNSAGQLYTGGQYI
jgi:hypothetical protein